MTADVTLRPAREDDREFLARVYASTREEELERAPFAPDQKAAFLAQQFAAQTAHYARHYAGASFEVVVVDGRPAGRLIVADLEDEVLVVDIALLPAFRARGIGTRLLRPILDRATAAGKRTGIHVERFNPAQTLYRRLGFEVVADDGVYMKMERPPGAPQPKIASYEVPAASVAIGTMNSSSGPVTP